MKKINSLFVAVIALLLVPAVTFGALDGLKTLLGDIGG